MIKIGINDDWYNNLVELVGCWRRIELQKARQKGTDRKKEDKRRREEEERKRRESEKTTFVRKYFPDCSHTAGGTTKLVKDITGENMKIDTRTSSNILGHPSTDRSGMNGRTELISSPHFK